MDYQKQLIALREYAQTIQRENAAKVIQNQTLYRQISSLHDELFRMEKYYKENKQLKHDVIILNETIANLQSQLIQKNISLTESEEIFHQKLLLQQKYKQTTHQISQLQSIIQSKAYQIQRLQRQFASLKRENSEAVLKIDQFSQRLDQIQQQNQSLRMRLEEVSNEEVDRNLQELADNYQKIELVVLQKEEVIRQMEGYITQLEEQCHQLQDECTRTQAYAKQIENELRSLQMRKSLREVSEDNLSFLTHSISKIDLIRQNNRMLQRINQVENQNHLNRRDPRQAYSECGQDKTVNNSPSKLQMRIQTLKMENESLLRALAV